MKRKIFLACLLVLAILTTSMVPLCVFAEDQVFSISGYVEVFPEFISRPGEFGPGFSSDFLNMLRNGINVTVEGTDFSAVTDADGYFEIKNIPAKETGYVLKVSGYRSEKQVVIDSFTKDVVYEKSSPIRLQFNADLDNNGAVNAQDIIKLAAYYKPVYKICGYVEVRGTGGSFSFESIGIPERPTLPDGFVDGLKKGIKVTVDGTDFSAVTDADGYFEIKSIPARNADYVLKFKGAGVEEKQVVINSFKKDVVYEKSSPVSLEFSWDLNGDGVINMTDVMVITEHFNQRVNSYKISGYIDIIKMPMPAGSEKFLFLEDAITSGFAERQRFIYGLKEGVKVTIDGTDLSATSDANGYFEINNVPAKVTGYTLKFAREYLREKQVVIDSFTKDVAYEKSSPVIMQFSYDINGDGVINMIDIMAISSFNNKVIDTYKISGYVAPNFEAKDSSIKSLFKVEIDETISTFTDKNGYFEFEAIPKNETGYTLKISKANYLYSEVKIDSLTSDVEVSSKEKPITMNVGDINGDNAINLTDIMLIASAFNTKAGEDKYMQKYDLNMDGAINLVDILTAAKSFNKTAQGL